MSKEEILKSIETTMTPKEMQTVRCPHCFDDRMTEFLGRTPMVLRFLCNCCSKQFDVLDNTHGETLQS